MLSIVNTRIYLQEGDDVSFKLLYRDSEGDIHNFKSSDMITLTIRDMHSREVILSKISETFKVQGEDTLVMRFPSGEISHGDYIYDLILDTNVGSRHTLIDRAFINVLKDPAVNDVDFQVGRLVSLDSETTYISSTPLICRFDYVEVDAEEVDGTLITYDDDVYDREDTDVEDPENPDDSLILFNILDDNGDTPPDEDTLILF